MRRVTAALVGAVAGGAVAALLWLPLLALFALAVGGSASFEADRLRSASGAVLIGAPPCLGLAQGALTGALRGRTDAATILEAALSPFAWVMTAGEGMV